MSFRIRPGTSSGGVRSWTAGGHIKLEWRRPASPELRSAQHRARRRPSRSPRTRPSRQPLLRPVPGTRVRASTFATPLPCATAFSHSPSATPQKKGRAAPLGGPARQLPDRRAGELALVALRGRHDSLPLRRGHLPRPAAPTTEAEILRHSPFTSSRPATPYEAGTASCSGEGGCSTVSSPPRSSSASFRASFGAGHSMRSRSRAIQGAPKRAVTDPPTWRGQARSGSRG